MNLNALLSRFRIDENGKPVQYYDSAAFTPVVIEDMTDEELKKIARDERTARYAHQLMADGRVKDVKVTGEDAFTATVEESGRKVSVSVGFEKGQLVSCACSCGSPVAKYSVCAHVGAVCLELSKEGRMQILQNKARKGNASSMLAWFDTPPAREASLKLLVTLEISENTPAAAYVTLRVGQKRMYVVQDLSSFVKAYMEGEDIPFGKGLTIEPH